MLPNIFKGSAGLTLFAVPLATIMTITAANAQGLGNNRGTGISVEAGGLTLSPRAPNTSSKAFESYGNVGSIGGIERLQGIRGIEEIPDIKNDESPPPPSKGEENLPERDTIYGNQTYEPVSAATGLVNTVDTPGSTTITEYERTHGFNLSAGSYSLQLEPNGLTFKLQPPGF